MAKSDDTGTRYIPAGSCTWCGHKPHAVACRSKIRTGKNQSASCPCSKRVAS